MPQGANQKCLGGKKNSLEVKQEYTINSYSKKQETVRSTREQENTNEAVTLANRLTTEKCLEPA